MNQEDLKKMKQRINELPKEEKRLRDKYLQELSNGTLQGPPVGYPSIDKSWLKFYDLNREDTFVGKTVYQGLYESNKDYPNDVAIEYFFSKISFKELFKNIEKTACSFEANGVKKGDFVTICAPGIPETIYSFFALAKIGAVSNMIAPHFEKKDFVERIKDCNSQILVVMDSFYEEIRDGVKDSIIKKVVIIPTLNSSILRFFSKKIKLNKSNQEVYWNDFINEGNKIKNSNMVSYDANMPLTMVYSSGTTGASKGIVLSNDSFINSICNYFKSGLDISRGQKFYQIIPTWYSTGISTSICLPLFAGASVYMDPRYERDIFVKNILKAKPNYCIATTSMYEGLLDNVSLKNKDLSFFKNAFEGGEPLSKEIAERINRVFFEHGNNSSIKVGYGQCECGATITTQTDKTEHCNDSVGIPLPGYNIQICDGDFNELQTNMRGQILVDTSARMLGYYKNDKATDEYFFIDSTGKKWNCTGDIGYVDDNGYLFVQGRASDYSIINDELIYNFDIENIIKNINGIKMFDVLPTKDENGNDVLAVHIVLNEETYSDGLLSLFEEIQNRIYSATNNINMVPTLFKVRKDFPYAKSGKRDTNRIKNEIDGFIRVDFNSNQLSSVRKNKI